MHRLSILFLCLASFFGAAIAESEPGTRGAELLGPFKKQLKTALMEGMKQGPGAAISVCRIKAPGIAADLSTGDVEMGRTSHRLRNPANQSPDWVVPVLDSYVRNPGDRTPRVVALDEAKTGYVEPIIVQPVCLTCHGPVLADDVASRIAELYPQDEAVGFEAGDLRGVFWVEYPSDQ